MRARELLERAVLLAPDAPLALAALGRQLAAMGEREAAVRALEQAREVGAFSPPLDVDLASECLALGKRRRAVALLRPIAAYPHGGRTSQRARELLEELEDLEG